MFYMLILGLVLTSSYVFFRKRLRTYYKYNNRLSKNYYDKRGVNPNAKTYY